MKTLVKELSVAPQPALALKQVVLWIGANSGGVGKTTLSVHVGYEMARRGVNVALLDLDSNGSMNLFCGLSRSPSADQTMAAVLAENFEGGWPLVSPEWGHPNGKLEVCQGGPIMSRAADDLSTRKRREYVLADRLQDYPLPHDLIILDCPATLGTLNDAGLAAATHLLVPVQLTYKSVKGATGLLSWYRATCRELRLNPAPKILGFVPSQYDASQAAQRKILDELPEQLAQLQIRCYPQVRYSSEFNNSSGRGLPLQLYRSSHAACGDFLGICDDLSALLQEEG